MNTSVDFDNVMSLVENVTSSTLSSSCSNEEWWYWRVALYAAAGAFIECAGVVCNIISIIVLVNFRNCSSAPFLLICLAVFDSIYLLSILVLEGITIMSAGELVSESYRQFIIPIYGVLYPLPLVAQTCVVYLVDVITVERFTVVSWPFMAHRICSIKSARIAVLAIMIFGIIYHIPTYMAFNLHRVWINETQQWVTVFSRNEFGWSDFYITTYMKWMNIVVNFAIPFAILFVFNTLMIKSIRKAKSDVALIRSFTREEHRLTLMVFCMTAIFFVCELLAALSHIVMAGYTNYHQPSVAANRFSAIADTFLLVNSAINFAIYCVTGRKFRHTFVRLFCRCNSQTNTRNAFVISAGMRSKQEYSKARLSSTSTRPSVPRRSTTDSSLSSVSNGTRSSKCTLSSDSINNKLNLKNLDDE